MERNNQTPTDTDIVADLRGLQGAGASQALLGQVAEAAKQIDAQVSSLKCGPSVRLQRTNGEAERAGDQWLTC